MPARAAEILRSCLEGMDVLFGRVAIDGWQTRVQRVLATPEPESMARGYLRMSAGSASGTFHDLIISEFNGHPVTEQQEAWVNELLTTFQAIAEAAARAIVDSGPEANLPVTPSVAARRIPGLGTETFDRRHVRVYAIDCRTCGSPFLLDTAAAEIAAKRWAVLTAPSLIVAGRSVVLVAIALDPDIDAHARRAVAEIRPVVKRLNLPAIRMPYNRPGKQSDDRCPVCGGDDWRPAPFHLKEHPLRLVPGP